MITILREGWVLWLYIIGAAALGSTSVVCTMAYQAYRSPLMGLWASMTWTLCALSSLLALLHVDWPVSTATLLLLYRANWAFLISLSILISDVMLARSMGKASGLYKFYHWWGGLIDWATHGRF